MNHHQDDRDAANTSLAGDILRGAAEIAQFVLGSAKQRRKVYGLIKRKNLPHFRIGNSVCARKSVLVRWIEGQENHGKHSGV